MDFGSKHKHGRFIKKDDPIRKVMNISEFSLAEICEYPLTEPDNALANIIHERLHDPKELATGIRSSHEINTVFTPQEERMLIHPIDFTEEWARLRKRQANRQSRNDDDEDLEIEANQTQSRRQDDDDLIAAEPMPNFDKIPLEKELTHTTAPDPEPIVEAVKEPIRSETPIPPVQQESAFIPYSSKPEVIAVEQRPSEEELEAIREAARSEGYRQGYQLGEEKATLETRQKVQAILTEVVSIIHELQGMQQSILNQAQDNFHSICRSLIESLLHREFRLNPDAFGTVIARAIAEAVPDDEYFIYVSPEVAQELKSWDNDDLRRTLRTDDSLEGFHFRIEGKNSSVDAKLDKIVADLLDQADLDLFETRERAG